MTERPSLTIGIEEEYQIVEPETLLLEEPLSNLDAKLRLAMRGLIGAAQTCVLVQ